jgi:uncharacterized protein (TIGR02145 family)
MITKINFFALAVICVFGLKAQTFMNIHQNNGTVMGFPLNSIDSITYTPNGSFTTGNGVNFDGYNYQSVVLGNGQEWMAENLRTSRFANGDVIPNVTNVTEWSNLTSEAWVHFNNNIQYESPYGKLYNGFTVMDPRNVCPYGWHVPSDNEWTALSDYFGGIAVAGGKMKSTGTQYWLSPNQAATNESGFSGLPGGYRDSYQAFSQLGTNGYWWSSTDNWSTNLIGIIRILKNTDGSLTPYEYDKRYGFSVRCLKD